MLKGIHLKPQHREDAYLLTSYRVNYAEVIQIKTDKLLFLLRAQHDSSANKQVQPLEEKKKIQVLCQMLLGYTKDDSWSFYSVISLRKGATNNISLEYWRRNMPPHNSGIV